VADPIKITGLNQFVRDLKKIDNDLPKAVRRAFNAATGIIVDYARPRVPRRTGRAAATIKPRSTQTAARVVEGGRRAPYMPWLDFGGKAGPGRGVRRPWIADGRFLYPALIFRSGELHQALVDALLGVVAEAGIEVE